METGKIPGTMSTARSVWISITGQKHVPIIVGSIIVYFLAFTTCYLLQRVAKRILPPRFYPYAADFFFTMVICIYPYSHGTVRSLFGHVGYLLTAVPLSTFTGYFFEGTCSPLSVFHRYLRGKETLRSCVAKTAIQTAAAFLSFQLTYAIWSLEVTKQHRQNLRQTECESDLNIDWMSGFMIEFCAVVADTWVSEHRLIKNKIGDTAIKNAFGCILVCSGVHITGMYMHPAMASGLSWNCEGTNFLEHFLVYWVSAFLGLLAGLELNERIYLPNLILEDAIVTPLKENIIYPVMENIVDPVMENVVQPMYDNVVDNVVQPVMDNIVQPMMDNVIQPVVENFVQPVVENVVDNVLQPVVENVVHPAVETMVDSIITPAVDSVMDNVIQPVTDSVMDNVVTPMVENVVQPAMENMMDNVVQPVVDSVVENIVQPVKDSFAGGESAQDESVGENVSDLGVGDAGDDLAMKNGSCKQSEDLSDLAQSVEQEDFEVVGSVDNADKQLEGVELKLVKGTFNLADLEDAMLKQDADDHTFEKIGMRDVAGEMYKEVARESEAAESYEYDATKAVLENEWTKQGKLSDDCGAVGIDAMSDNDAMKANAGLTARKRIRQRKE